MGVRFQSIFKALLKMLLRRAQKNTCYRDFQKLLTISVRYQWHIIDKNYYAYYFEDGDVLLLIQ